MTKTDFASFLSDLRIEATGMSRDGEHMTFNVICKDAFANTPKRQVISEVKKAAFRALELSRNNGEKSLPAPRGGSSITMRDTCSHHLAVRLLAYRAILGQCKKIYWKHRCVYM